jgi:hypothetical protein
MKPTRTRLAVVVAALSTIAVAAPVSTAGAATAAPAVTPVAILATGWNGSPAVTVPVTSPVAGQAATVIGPTFITTAPATFINTNTQVSSGDSLAGAQSAT